MQQTVFEIDVPKTILDYGFSKVDVQSHVNEWSVLQLFTEDHISSGKAARLLDITRVEFLDMLYKKRISYLDYTPEELEDEFATLKTFKTPSEKHQISSILVQ